ncbi:MAG: toxic anion resistance protein, partial [Absicoccus porci]
MQEKPHLTLNPDEDTNIEENLTKKNPPLAEDIQIDESQFTPEEKEQIQEFAKKIDITDNMVVLQYGINAQKKLANFSDKALAEVRTKDLGEVGNMLSDVVTQLRDFDVNEEKKGFAGLFNKGKNRVEKLTVRYNAVESNVNKVATMLEDHQVRLMKDTSMLEQMFQMNNTYYKELNMYIIAGKQRLNETYQKELPALRAKAEQTQNPEDMQAAQDLAQACDRFDKKLHDLQMSRMIAIQTAPQLRLLQNNNSLMIEKIQSTLVNTIPLWKSQMVIALGLNHATQAAKAQREVTNTTNELLRRNANALHTATVETAKESNRDIVDIETLKHTNEQLIQT